MTARQIFKLEKREYNKLRYPTVPAHAHVDTLPTDKNANGLTRLIIEYIRLKGGQAERISNTGRYISTQKKVVDCIGRTKVIGSGKYVKGSGVNGTADISATIGGKSVKIEVKIGADKQSIDQKNYKASVVNSGGLYFVAKNFQEFFDWYHATFSR